MMLMLHIDEIPWTLDADPEPARHVAEDGEE